jgi:molybdate transport system substrate-binding protein
MIYLRSRPPLSGAVAAALALGLLAACGAPGPSEGQSEGPTAEAAGEVTVFAAASLRDAMQEVGELYREATGVEPVFNFAGSNELARQILAAPRADVYLPANEKWMDEVETAGRVVEGTRGALLSNRLVVIARTDSPHRVAAPEDLATLPHRHLVLAQPDAVPAGIYAREWLASKPAPGGEGTLWDAVAERVAPTLDVRAALGLVESDPDLVGIVYRTDAASSERVHTLYEVPEAEGPRIVYAAAAIAGGPNPEAGRSFVDFLAEPAASEVFERHGFVPRRDG